MVLAQGLTVESATAKHTVGQRYIDPATGAEYIYCQDDGSANAQYKPCCISPAFTTALITTAGALKEGYRIGVPQIAVTASYYYWCMVHSGNTSPQVHTASACASEAMLYTTAIAGRLDDAAGTALAPITGIALTATAATAAASANTACTINYPRVVIDNELLSTIKSTADSG